MRERIDSVFVVKIAELLLSSLCCRLAPSEKETILDDVVVQMQQECLSICKLKQQTDQVTKRRIDARHTTTKETSSQRAPIKKTERKRERVELEKEAKE